MPKYTMRGRACALLALASALILAGCSKPAPATTAASAASPAAVAAATSAAPPTGQPAADAKAFLEGLYAHYKSAKDHSFSPMDAAAREVFDPELIQLMADDSKVLKGEVGAIDGDFLCDCQDYETINATVAVQSATPTTAKATADFKVFDQTHHNSFDLVNVNGAWRIHDVTEAGQPSLRTMLRDEIRDMSKATPKKGNPNVAP